MKKKTCTGYTFSYDWFGTKPRFDTGKRQLGSGLLSKTFTHSFHLVFLLCKQLRQLAVKFTLLHGLMA